MKHSIYILALVSSLAYAGAPDSKQPEPRAVATQDQQQAAIAQSEADAAARARAEADLRAEIDITNTLDAQGGRARLDSDITGGNNSAEAVGSVDASDRSRFDSKALALGMIRAAAAPNVSATCLVHTRGWDVTVASRTGGTKFDEQCVTDEKCFRIAETYAMWGLVQAAVDQLAKCGGLTDIKVPPQGDFVTREEMKERERRMIDAVGRK